MVCLVVTRNGIGDVYKFPDKKAARLHPVAQAYDVFAADPIELAAQYGRDEIEAVLRYAEGRDRSRLIDAFEAWKSEPKTRILPFEARSLIWTLLLGKAKEPPSDPVELLSIIVEDRRALEDRRLRSRSESTTLGDFSPMKRKEQEMSEAETKARRARTSEDAVIKLLVDKNPKREGSKAFDRFALYRDGMTVKAAKEAGVTSSDLLYDSDSSRNYISITEPEPAPAAE